MLDTILLIALIVAVGYLIYRVETGDGGVEVLRNDVAHLQRHVIDEAKAMREHVKDEVGTVKEHISTVLRHKDMP